jgi:hypothetical protein
MAEASDLHVKKAVSRVAAGGDRIPALSQGAHQDVCVFGVRDCGNLDHDA